MVAAQIKTLKIRMMAMACAGRLFTSLSLFAPRYWEIIEEMAERDCPKTQMSMDKKEETMPTDACQYFYKCEGCKKVLKPINNDCCVYCSYGSIPCPPIQESKSCRGSSCC